MDLTEYIATVNDFPVPGVNFRDVTPLLSEPAAFRASVDRLLAASRDTAFDTIAAFDARGFLWGAPMAYRLGLPLVPIRKAGKLPRAHAAESYRGEYGDQTVIMHHDALTAGDAVLLVDDVIATGESMRAGCRLVERTGATVAACAALIELHGLGARDRLRGYSVVSLLQY